MTMMVRVWGVRQSNPVAPFFGNGLIVGWSVSALVVIPAEAGISLPQAIALAALDPSLSLG